MAQTSGVLACWPRLPILLFLSNFLTAFSTFASAFPTASYSVQATATVQESPPKISLAWVADPQATSYEISRRTPEASWQPVATVGGGENAWSDSGISTGTRYEYKLIKRTNAGYTGYGYITSGIRLPVVDDWGKLILLVESSLAGPLASELTELQSDLTGDGWTVIRRDVSMNDSPPAVKEQIKAIYDSDPARVKALFLFGHIPVPYSGNINPDGHPNHQGAWPADSYYADMDGVWTDSTVNTTASERDVNWNVPGDGRFDQSVMPSNAELMVGRVDLNNMTCYANKLFSRSEIDLMRSYIYKDHAFRTGQMIVQKRGIICDNFADKGEDPISGSAWRNWPAFFGPQNISSVPWDGYLPATTRVESYLWSYASGGGSYYYSTGVATSDDFALNDVQVVFTMFLGSYFGDWNNESNFLRAALGSGNILTSTYSGAPHTLYFPMSMGLPIGYCIRLTQNNATNTLYEPWVQGSSQVHIALMGDPTLRLSPVKPASNLQAATSPGTATLTWNGSTDSAITGYHVYRASTKDGPFARVTDSPVNATTYADYPPEGSWVYMVRAIKLEQSGSGTYLNPSQGVFVSATVTGSVPRPPNAPVLQATPVSHTRIDLTWAVVENANGYRLEFKSDGNWSPLISLNQGSTNFAVDGLQPLTTYSFRALAFNSIGSSLWSSEVQATTLEPPAPQATVTFLSENIQASGYWPVLAGASGIALPEGASPLPQTIHLWTSGSGTTNWQTRSTDSRAPLVSATSTNRLAAAWKGNPISLNLDVSSDQPIETSLYFLDWERLNRTQRVTVYDITTQQVIDTRDVFDFGEGTYLTYRVKGNVLVTVSPLSSDEAVLSGVFFGGAVPGNISNKPLSLSFRAGTDGRWIVTLRGDSGQRFQLESSADLKNWQNLTSGVLSTTNTTLSVISPYDGRCFLRTINIR